MSRWVQHMSGQGKKYELTDNIWNRENNSSWEAHNTISNNLSWLYLPRSEYRECPLPHRRVTGKCYTTPGSDWLCLPSRDARSAFAGTTWKLVRKEDLADGEVCLVIEEGE